MIQIQREIEIHSIVDHPNIIKFYGFFHDAQRIYILMEYAFNGELFTHMNNQIE